MRRREFITLPAARRRWPIAARAQQPAMPVIGFLIAICLIRVRDRLRAFRQGLKETGYIEGQNVAVEYHSAGAILIVCRSLVTDMVRRRSP